MALLPDVGEVINLAGALAPGLIILGVRSRVVVGSLPDYKDRLIAYALVSAAYLAGLSPLFHVAGGMVLSPLLWGALQYVVVPFGLGLVAAYIYQYELADRLAHRVGLDLAHRIPTAWDFTFSKLEAGTFVLVTLGDGSQVAGRMGQRSSASSSRGERDMLIEEVWEVEGTGSWSILEPHRSILISAREVRYVEIFEV